MRIDPETSLPAEQPPSSSEGGGVHAPALAKPGLIARMKSIFKPQEKTDSDLREVIEEYIVEPEGINSDSVSTHERVLFSNILKLRDISVLDVMIPRADIIAIDVDSSNEELYELMAEKQASRLPVYKDSLDNVLGTVHIKDIVAAIAAGQSIDLQSIITDVPIVSPSMPILDLVLRMRTSRRHMALVVDEYGGIDGLITLGDVIEEIIGEIDDEHDTQEEPQLQEKDGVVMADARVELEEFEARYGLILNEKEREESDTLGGLVFALAGRVPVRGEVITHASGMMFEVLEADARRISTLKITKIPKGAEKSLE